MTTRTMVSIKDKQGNVSTHRPDRGLIDRIIFLSPTKKKGKAMSKLSDAMSGQHFPLDKFKEDKIVLKLLEKEHNKKFMVALFWKNIEPVAWDDLIPPGATVSGGEPPEYKFEYLGKVKKQKSKSR